MSLDISRLVSALERFKDIKVLVIGDIILDVFLWGVVNRISPEAPVPVVDIKKETYQLGGASNVAHNIVTLGGKVSIIGRIGKDKEGEIVLGLLDEKGINREGVVVSQEIPTTVKTRVIAHSQQVVRFDKEVKKKLNDRDFHKIEPLLNSLEDFHIIVVSDYAKGVIDEKVMGLLKGLSNKLGIPLIVDPKVSNKSLYKDVTLLAPNNLEASQMAGFTREDLWEVSNSDGHLIEVSKRILEELNCRYLLITRGSKGMSLFERGKDPVHVPAVAKKVFDVTGAGDTVVATLSLGIASGLSVLEASYLANFAAGYVVGEVGIATISQEELKKIVEKSTYL